MVVFFFLLFLENENTAEVSEVNVIVLPHNGFWERNQDLSMEWGRGIFSVTNCRAHYVNWFILLPYLYISGLVIIRRLKTGMCLEVKKVMLCRFKYNPPKIVTDIPQGLVRWS